MKQFGQFVLSSLVRGLLIIIPLYLAVLLLLKAAKSLAGLVRPLAMLLPEWLPAEGALSLLLVLFVCFLVSKITQMLDVSAVLLANQPFDRDEVVQTA